MCFNSIILIQKNNGAIQGLGVRVFRPTDYYAEMAKSDTHMQKVPFHLFVFLSAL